MMAHAIRVILVDAKSVCTLSRVPGWLPTPAYKDIGDF